MLARRSSAIWGSVPAVSTGQVKWTSVWAGTQVVNERRPLSKDQQQSEDNTLGSRGDKSVPCRVMRLLRLTVGRLLAA